MQLETDALAYVSVVVPSTIGGKYQINIAGQETYGCKVQPTPSSIVVLMSAITRADDFEDPQMLNWFGATMYSVMVKP